MHAYCCVDAWCDTWGGFRAGLWRAAPLRFAAQTHPNLPAPHTPHPVQCGLEGVRCQQGGGGCTVRALQGGLPAVRHHGQLSRGPWLAQEPPSCPRRRLSVCWARRRCDVSNASASSTCGRFPRTASWGRCRRDAGPPPRCRPLEALQACSCSGVAGTGTLSTFRHPPPGKVF